jgi:hypothetical protein
MGERLLNPEPVKVTAVAAEPTVTGVVGVAEVMIGATVLAAPTPKAPARLETSVLLPAPVPLVIVRPQTGVPVRAVTTIVAVPEVGLVIVAPAIACVTVTPLIVSVAVFVMSVKQAAVSELVSDKAAPNSKPEPSKVTGTLAIAAAADGLTFSRPLPTVKAPASVAEPPSAFVTVTPKVPAVAGAPPEGFVGVTLKTIEVAVDEVTVAVRPVPSTVEANETLGEAKPVPVMVTVVGAEPSHTEAGLIAEIVGGASTVMAAASEALVPFASTSTTEQDPATVPVSAKSAVAVEEDVSVTEVNATATPVVHVAVNVSFVAPLLAKPVPVIAAVPDEPAPMALAVAPWGVNATAVTVGAVAAPATEAIAMGSAAAASKAPAAIAFTKWRCIRRGLFMVNSLHS